MLSETTTKDTKSAKIGALTSLRRSERCFALLTAGLESPEHHAAVNG